MGVEKLGFSKLVEETLRYDAPTNDFFGSNWSRSGEAALAGLRDIDVYTLGLDNAGRTIAYWEALRDSWTEYLTMRSSPAQLLRFARAITIRVLCQ